MYTSDVLGYTGNATAGAAITQDANGRFPLVQQMANGLAPVQYSDTANKTQISTGNATNTISGSQWTGGTGISSSSYYAYQQTFIASDNLLTYVNYPTGSQAGLYIFKRSASGNSAIGSYIVESTSVTIGFYDFCQLSNGNIAIAYGDVTNGQVKYAVYSAGGAVVKATTNILSTSVATSSGAIWVKALTGGGFAILSVISGGAVYVGAYNNSGTATYAFTNIDTGANGNYFANQSNLNQLVALSNGNFAIAYVNSARTTLKYAVYSSTGTAVVALTSLTCSTNYGVNLSALSGYFAMQYAPSGSDYYVNVYNNAGTQQGTSFQWSLNQNQSTTPVPRTLTNDGTNFYSVAFVSSSYVGLSLATIPITGSASATVIVNTDTSKNSTMYVGASSAFHSYAGNGVIYLVNGYTSTTQSSFFTSLRLDNAQYLVTPYNIVNTSPASNGYSMPSISYIGDGAMVVSTMLDGTIYYNFLKGQNTAIQGVATNTAAVGGVVSVKSYSQTGTSFAAACQTIGGTQGQTFNHTTGATIPGVQGYMLGNTAIIKGY